MGQLEDILKHQNMVRNNIMKSFGVEISENSLEKSFEDEINPFEMEAYKSELTKAELDWFEKAKHQDGDMHPNGKWVWRQSANGGKGDWRVANPRRGGGSSKTTSSASNADQSSANNNQQPSNQPNASSSSSDTSESSDSKKQSVEKTPDTMVGLYKELSDKFGQENKPFVYTNNGFLDLKKKGKKGYATWVGFQHTAKGRQPVDKTKMRNFIAKTAVDQLLSLVNEKTGKKYTSKDVKIEDYWDSTDMYRLYIEVDNSDDNSKAAAGGNKPMTKKPLTWDDITDTTLNIGGKYAVPVSLSKKTQTIRIGTRKYRVDLQNEILLDFFTGKKMNKNHLDMIYFKRFLDANRKGSRSIYGDDGYMSQDFLSYLEKNKEKIWPKDNFSEYTDVRVTHRGSKDSNYVAITGKKTGSVARHLIDDAFITGEGSNAGYYQVRANPVIKELTEKYKNGDVSEKN